MYTQEIQEWINKGNHIFICPPSNKRPEVRKGVVYSKNRRRCASYLPPARDLNFDYSA